APSAGALSGARRATAISLIALPCSISIRVCPPESVYRTLMSSERPVNDIRDPGVIGVGPLDVHLFHEGTHQNAYATLGAHVGGAPFSSYVGPGVRFAVWAPAAHQVSVVGDWNYWSDGATPLVRLGDTGIWAGVDVNAQVGHRYK